MVQITYVFLIFCSYAHISTAAKHNIAEISGSFSMRTSHHMPLLLVRNPCNTHKCCDQKCFEEPEICAGTTFEPPTRCILFYGSPQIDLDDSGSSVIISDYSYIGLLKPITEDEVNMNKGVLRSPDLNDGNFNTVMRQDAHPNEAFYWAVHLQGQYILQLVQVFVDSADGLELHICDKHFSWHKCKPNLIKPLINDLYFTVVFNRFCQDSKPQVHVFLVALHKSKTNTSWSVQEMSIYGKLVALDAGHQTVSVQKPSRYFINQQAGHQPGMVVNDNLVDTCLSPSETSSYPYWMLDMLEDYNISHVKVHYERHRSWHMFPLTLRVARTKEASKFLLMAKVTEWISRVNSFEVGVAASPHRHVDVLQGRWLQLRVESKTGMLMLCEVTVVVKMDPQTSLPPPIQTRSTRISTTQKNKTDDSNAVYGVIVMLATVCFAAFMLTLTIGLRVYVPLQGSNGRETHKLPDLDVEPTKPAIKLETNDKLKTKNSSDLSTNLKPVIDIYQQWDDMKNENETH